MSTFQNGSLRHLNSMFLCIITNKYYDCQYLVENLSIKGKCDYDKI